MWKRGPPGPKGSAFRPRERCRTSVRRKTAAGNFQAAIRFSPSQPGPTREVTSVLREADFAFRRVDPAHAGWYICLSSPKTLLVSSSSGSPIPKTRMIVEHCSSVGRTSPPGVCGGYGTPRDRQRPVATTSESGRPGAAHGAPARRDAHPRRRTPGEVYVNLGAASGVSEGEEFVAYLPVSQIDRALRLDGEVIDCGPYR
jgi:hypothetical protein